MAPKPSKHAGKGKSRGKMMPVQQGTGRFQTKEREWNLENTEACDFALGTSSPGTDPHAYRINPGDPEMFPWLNQVATRFEKYKFSSLEFHFTTSEATTVGGSLITSIDYDTADPVVSAYPYTSLLNQGTSQVAAVRVDQVLRVPRDKLGPRRFVQAVEPEVADAVAARYLERDSDLGMFSYAMASAEPSIFAGIFTVKYSVTLYAPQTDELAGGEGGWVSDTSLDWHSLIGAPSAWYSWLLTGVQYALFIYLRSAAAVPEQLVAPQVPDESGMIMVRAPGSPPAPNVENYDVLKFKRRGRYLVTMKLTGTSLTANKYIMVHESLTTAGYAAWSVGSTTLTSYAAYVITVSAANQTFAPYYDSDTATITNSEAIISTMFKYPYV